MVFDAKPGTIRFNKQYAWLVWLGKHDPEDRRWDHPNMKTGNQRWVTESIRYAVDGVASGLVYQLQRHQKGGICLSEMLGGYQTSAYLLGALLARRAAEQRSHSGLQGALELWLAQWAAPQIVLRSPSGLVVSPGGRCFLSANSWLRDQQITALITGDQAAFERERPIDDPLGHSSRMLRGDLEAVREAIVGYYDPTDRAAVVDWAVCYVPLAVPLRVRNYDSGELVAWLPEGLRSWSDVTLASIVTPDGRWRAIPTYPRPVEHGRRDGLWQGEVVVTEHMLTCEILGDPAPRTAASHEVLYRDHLVMPRGRFDEVLLGNGSALDDTPVPPVDEEPARPPALPNAWPRGPAPPDMVTAARHWSTAAALADAGEPIRALRQAGWGCRVATGWPKETSR